ncbi:MAG: cytochrome c oxidase assembly protein [Hoeflea sp.]|uniref:cytochrome c oxidase assembly protein n=1 Tax=Hoeflea sp. TaxID=1940281 RepID=UPI001D2FC363|nr:cytochrome c oxidase assembly protein [Hoeflea sp.]MBU4528082.1 cytochrome c oxidase assembly protein [Alphaproteobacteria bacterium]MBU4543678.1 cytochrome c oxidase assembly protein [Alphaproteobacteria bacterium]MBU4548545.1 cytochrome c oxidase assembly protein [Alphaproteobacteria bacterium]MBV1725711.1 cytochrome c oxidase assembly protein [Hoeflea sp.]MBV1762067.1 cytochrome c oxidase assembly protein [Hoeflea sp.]
MEMQAHAMMGTIDAMMLWHIALMNALAPAIAYSLRTRLPASLETSIFLATALQIGLLWGWHSPAALEAAMQYPVAGIAMHISLFLSALWFWGAVVTTSERGSWRALVALLLTGKLFCLLGALLVFSNSSLYPAHGSIASLDAAVAHQQRAGLLMLALCPLTYVAAGIVLSIRWFRRLARQQLV